MKVITNISCKSEMTGGPPPFFLLSTEIYSQGDEYFKYTVPILLDGKGKLKK